MTCVALCIILSKLVVGVAAFSAMDRRMFTTFMMIPKPESMVLKLFMSVWVTAPIMGVVRM